MSTPNDFIREKAQRILMLQSLIKAQREQNQFELMSDSIAKLDNLAEEVRSYAFDHDLFEGIVVYTNATSFIYRLFEDDGFHSMSLPYSVIIAKGLFVNLASLQLGFSKDIDSFKTAHFFSMALSQIIMSYLGALRVKENEDNLYEADIIGVFKEIVCYFQGAFEYMRQVASQSRMTDLLQKLFNKTREWWKAEDKHRELKISGVLDACNKLYDELGKIEIKD